MNLTPVRTRFAPSPTGHLHIGGARTALFNYLYAKANKGSFVIRVEDTDKERSTRESENLIIESLNWLGLTEDEGVIKGGKYGPYRQSERINHYQKYIEILVKKKRAYPCFCTDKELEAKQEEAKVLGKPYLYDGQCRNLSEEEIKTRKAKNQKYTYRFSTEKKEIRVNDLVQGTVLFDSRLIGDFIIIKSNGLPSYNYAVVIDDYEMKITHVIRGVGHLSNTPRQILIHQALGLPLPIYAHISEIINTDQKKLSKRQGAFSILMFRELGYLAPALKNYMSLLGWYPRDSEEYMPDKKLEEKFNILHCSKSPSMFDFFLSESKVAPISENKHNTNSKKTTSQNKNELAPEPKSIQEFTKNINKKSKLSWLNNLYLRETALDKIWPTQYQWLKKDKKLSLLIYNLNIDEAKLKHSFDCIRTYLYTLSQASPYLQELFQESIKINSQEDRDLISLELSKTVISIFAKLIAKNKPNKPEDFSEIIKNTGKESKAKGRSLYMPIRIAVTGSNEGIELPILFSILGYERIIQRIKHIASL